MRKIIVGSDEVGRGALAGPIVAGAAIDYLDLGSYTCHGKEVEDLRDRFAQDNHFFLKYIFDGKDSKLLTSNQREKLIGKILNSYQCGIGVVDAKEIDLLGIVFANKLSIIRAINSLPCQVDLALIDGNLKFDDNRFFSIVQGDRLHPLICAASIIAKVYRDCLMQDLGKKFTAYNWQKNKGYGTKEHICAIKYFGFSPYHRITFKNSYKP